MTDEKCDGGQEFLTEFLQFFEKETGTEGGKPKGQCSGDLIITKTFAFSVIDDPMTFLNNLSLLGVNCDCKFLQGIGLFVIKDTGYSFESVTKTTGGVWVIDWSMEGFRIALEALSHNALGVKIVGAGYFPPDSAVELMLHESQTFSIIMVKEAYSPFEGEL